MKLLAAFPRLLNLAAAFGVGEEPVSGHCRYYLQGLATNSLRKQFVLGSLLCRPRFFRQQALAADLCAVSL
jgi:hypothetical protein